MAHPLFPNQARIFSLITVVWMAIFSSGCYGVIPATQRPVDPPTSVFEKVEIPPIKSSPGTRVISNTTPPTAVPVQATLAVPPSLSLGELLEGLVINDLRVGILLEGDNGTQPEQPCIFSPDNFYTCTVLNRLTQTIQVTFTINHQEDFSAEDLERLQASMELVVYPYRMISRYTPAPPLVDEPIRAVSGGGWGTDFRINNSDRVFSFFLMAEGRSLAGANLYLIPPEPIPAAPLAEEEQEN